MTDAELLTICQARQSNMDLKNQIQEEMDQQAQVIGNELGARGVDTVDMGEYVARVLVSTRKTLDKKKLVELGVPVATIEAATVETDVQSLRVDRRKG